MPSKLARLDSSQTPNPSGEIYTISTQEGNRKAVLHVNTIGENIRPAHKYGFARMLKEESPDWDTFAFDYTTSRLKRNCPSFSKVSNRLMDGIQLLQEKGYEHIVVSGVCQATLVMQDSIAKLAQTYQKNNLKWPISGVVMFVPPSSGVKLEGRDHVKGPLPRFHKYAPDFLIKSMNTIAGNYIKKHTQLQELDKESDFVAGMREGWDQRWGRVTLDATDPNPIVQRLFTDYKKYNVQKLAVQIEKDPKNPAGGNFSYSITPMNEQGNPREDLSQLKKHIHPNNDRDKEISQNIHEWLEASVEHYPFILRVVHTTNDETVSEGWKFFQHLPRHERSGQTGSSLLEGTHMDWDKNRYRGEISEVVKTINAQLDRKLSVHDVPSKKPEQSALANSALPDRRNVSWKETLPGVETLPSWQDLLDEPLSSDLSPPRSFQPQTNDHRTKAPDDKVRAESKKRNFPSAPRRWYGR